MCADILLLAPSAHDWLYPSTHGSQCCLGLQVMNLDAQVSPDLTTGDNAFYSVLCVFRNTLLAGASLRLFVVTDT